MDENKAKKSSRPKTGTSSSRKLDTSPKSVKSKSRSPEKKGSASTSKSIKLKSSMSNKSSKSNKSNKSSKIKFNDQSEHTIVNIEELKSTDELEDLSLQSLTIINDRIFQKITLKKLILNGNNLRGLPSAIADLVYLEYLDLSKNPLKLKDPEETTCLPLEMRFLKNLKYLNISECNLRCIPATVWLCLPIEILDISRNKIGHLVPDVGNLQNLQYLNLSQCNLTTLPEEIGFCTELVEIILMGNHVDSLPDTLKDCRNLNSLRLSFSNFTSLLDVYMDNLLAKGQIKSEHIPMVIFDLEKLATLDLKRTKLNNLPENSLKNLQKLALDNNYFNSFTDNVFSQMCETLTTLTLSNNQFKEIPAELNCLGNLEVLNMGYNSISSFPFDIKLLKLRELYLNNNQLSSIHSSIGLLKNLTKLALDNNKLNGLCENLFDLVNLNYLDLSYNNLSFLSNSICKIKELKAAHSYEKLNKTGLWVIGNPLKLPPKEIWQTKSIEKIFDFLANYEQRNLKYIYFSKLIFLGSSGVGKSQLLDSLFNAEYDNGKPDRLYLDSHDYKTKVSRKFYKRTVNKVEWQIIDLAGDATYRCLDSIFLSSIDHQNDPCLFILTFDYITYERSEHASCIKPWIKTIFLHSKVSFESVIHIKLVGILNESLINENDRENSAKKLLILENCKQTIESLYETMRIELELVTEQIKSASNSNELSVLKQAKKRLESILKQRIQIDEHISLIGLSSNRQKQAVFLSELELKTTRLNKIAPLELRMILKTHLTRLKTDYILLDELKAYLSKSDEIKACIMNNAECNLDLDKILTYANSIGEIFWFKFNKNLSQHIFLRYNYILDNLRLFINHSLKFSHEWNHKNLFRTIGLYRRQDEYENAVELYKNQGILEQRLLNGICFETSQLNREEIADCIDLLQSFFIIYKSETQYLEERCSFFQIVIPSMCKIEYKTDLSFSKSEGETFDNLLYTDNYELFFYKLNQLRRLRETIKIESAIRKEKELWDFTENKEDDEYYADFQSESNNTGVALTTYSFLKHPPRDEVIHDFEKEKNDLQTESICSKHVCKMNVECSSPFKIENHIFSKLSVLVQKLAYERFDWSNTIILRTVDETCLRMQLLNDQENESSGRSKILIEIKALDAQKLNNLKDQINNVIDQLLECYPGFYLLKSFHLFS